jgi:hypothetical protein
MRYGVDQVNNTSNEVMTTAQFDPVGLFPNGMTMLAYCSTMKIRVDEYIRQIIMKTGDDGIDAAIFISSEGQTLIGGSPGNLQDTQQIEFSEASPLLGFYGH